MPTDIKVLYETLIAFYAENSRSMPWRNPELDGSFDQYKILVSELMLQQTQVNRVIPKFELFLSVYPTLDNLANAQLADVLKLWSGLGYNRRAKFLHEAAKSLSVAPGLWTEEALVAQKGIGSNTARAVLVYSQNLPLIFVETNIRTVLIHHYFKDKEQIHDTELIELLRELVQYQVAQKELSTRELYWALMDYGTHIKVTHGNANRLSTTYAKQSKFEGSKRQLRGRILKLLAERPYTYKELIVTLKDNRAGQVCKELINEKLIHETNKVLYLGS